MRGIKKIIQIYDRIQEEKGVIVCVNHAVVKTVKSAANLLPSVVARNNMQRGIDYIGVGVGAAIFNSEGKLFLTLLA